MTKTSAFRIAGAALPEAVRIMAKRQRDADLPEGEAADIVAFLETLTGEVPVQIAAAPALPVGPYRVSAGE